MTTQKTIFVKPKAVCDALSIDGRTLQLLISDGEIDAVKMRSTYRVEADSVRNYMTRNSITGKALTTNNKGEE